MVFARTGSPEPILAALRETMRSIDPDQPIYDAKTMEQVIWEDLVGNRIITGLFMALGLVSLTLAAVGLYGLNAFLVAQRSREIGVRMALGASAGDVVRMVISQGARLTAAGLAVGVTLGLLLGRAMSSILVEVTPTDPTTLLTTVGVLARFRRGRRPLGPGPPCRDGEPHRRPEARLGVLATIRGLNLSSTPALTSPQRARAPLNKPEPRVIMSGRCHCG